MCIGSGLTVASIIAICHGLALTLFFPLRAAYLAVIPVNVVQVPTCTIHPKVFFPRLSRRAMLRTRRCFPLSRFSPRLAVFTVRRSLSSMSKPEFLCIDAFCERQFGGANDGSSGSIDCDKETFLAKCLEYVNEKQAKGEPVLVDGYAPFCKHIFIPNFTPTKPCYVALTPEVAPLVETGYVARSEKELPVLTRSIPTSALPDVAPAKWLDLILYSREQIKIENAAMGTESKDTAEWGIVSVKAQNDGFETPMQPITAMRNALGASEGGSGIPLDREKYLESVAFWEKNVALV